MTPESQIDEIRRHYLNLFAGSCDSAVYVGERAITEAAYRKEDGSLATEGQLGLPLRGDIFIVAADGQPTRSQSVDSDTWPAFPPIDFMTDSGLHVSLEPFPWDACDITVASLAENVDWTPLKRWFEKWFNVADNGQADTEGFYQVVHFMSDPANEGGGTRFQVDFGSAPAAAFHELLAAFQQLGATKVDIGQRDAPG